MGHVEANDLVTDKVRELIGGGFVTTVVVLVEYVDETSGERYFYRAWNTGSNPWTRMGMCDLTLAEIRGVAVHNLLEPDEDD